MIRPILSCRECREGLATAERARASELATSRVFFFFFPLGSWLFRLLAATIRRSYMLDTAVRVALRFGPSQLAVHTGSAAVRGGTSEESSAAFFRSDGSV